MKQYAKLAPVISRRWELLPYALTAIQSKFSCDEADAFSLLKQFILDEQVHARGPIVGSRSEVLAAEAFRFSCLSPDGTGFTSLDTLTKIAWVEINMDKLRAVLTNIVVPRTEKDSPEERKAREWLTRDLVEKQNNDRTKSIRCSDAMRLFGISKRAFNDRLWPEAVRNQALTKDMTKPGRPRKSNHRTK